MQSLTKLGKRNFSSSGSCRGYYETLGVPHLATKGQIKSSFYKLSKQYHPDVNKDPKGREIYHAVTAAYAVLGNDRQRREYDRSLEHARRDLGAYPEWSYETRRRGATRAWESTRRPGMAYHQSHPGAQRRPPGFQQQQQHGEDPRDPLLSRRASRKKAHEAGYTDIDGVRRESALIRAVQVILLMSLAAVGGGWAATTG